MLFFPMKIFLLNTSHVRYDGLTALNHFHFYCLPTFLYIVTDLIYFVYHLDHWDYFDDLNSNVKLRFHKVRILLFHYRPCFFSRIVMKIETKEIALSCHLNQYNVLKNKNKTAFLFFLNYPSITQQSPNSVLFRT